MFGGKQKNGTLSELHRRQAAYVPLLAGDLYRSSRQASHPWRARALGRVFRSRVQMLFRRVVLRVFGLINSVPNCLSKFRIAERLIAPAFRYPDAQQLIE